MRPHTLHTLLLTLVQPCGLYRPPGSYPSHPFISLVISPLVHLFHSLLLLHLASTYHKNISTFVMSLLMENRSFLFKRCVFLLPPPSHYSLLSIIFLNCFPCNILPVLPLCYPNCLVRKHPLFLLAKPLPHLCTTFSVCLQSNTKPNFFPPCALFTYTSSKPHFAQASLRKPQPLISSSFPIFPHSCASQDLPHLYIPLIIHPASMISIIFHFLTAPLHGIFPSSFSPLQPGSTCL